MATNNAVNLKSSGIVSYDGAGAFTALANPLTVSNGGFGVTSNTAYAVLTGGTSSTNPIQSIASLGSSGYILKSNGASNLPTFQSTGVIAIDIRFAATNPLDSTTYTIVNTTSLSTSGDVASSRYYLPRNCTLTDVYGAITVTGTLAGAQNVTLNVVLNGSSSTAVTSSLQLTSADNSVVNTALSISFSAGDYFLFEMVTPAFSPNPTAVTGSFTFLFI